MKTYVLKNDAVRVSSFVRLVFEMGCFNLFVLVILFPAFWFQNLGAQCWDCCCSLDLETFYQGTLIRLGIIGLSWLTCNLLEIYFLKLMLAQESPDDWRYYLSWMCWRTLPLIALLLAFIALPEALAVYFVLALCGSLVFLGPVAVRWRWAPLIRFNGQEDVLPRHHFKALGVYLSVVLMVTLFLFSSRPWACACRAKLSSVKANMHTLQTIVETYAVDHKGVYAPSLTVLKQEATLKGREYWKEFTNPYTGKRGEGQSYDQMPVNPERLFSSAEPFRDILGLRIYFADPVANPDFVGKALYDPVSPTHYYIYGLDKQGKIILDKGMPLTLSNS